MDKFLAWAKKFVLTHKELVVLILITLIAHWAWLDIFNPQYGGDWRLWHDGAIERFINGGYGTYINDVDLGTQNIQMYFNALFWVWGLIGNYALASTLTLFLPIAILSVVSPYLLAYELSRDKMIAFALAIGYGFSTILLKLELAHLFIAIDFALAPLVLLTFIRLNGQPSIKRVLLFSILASLVLMMELRIGILIIAALILYALMNLSRQMIKRTWKHLIGSALVIGLLNLYWILPTLMAGFGAINAVANRGVFGSQFFTLEHALTAYDKYWSNGSLSPFLLQKVPLFAWALPVLVALSFLSYKYLKNKRMFLYFALISLIGIFMAKQAAEPFPDIYSWLYDNVPPFNLYREASKYFVFILLGYLGLLSSLSVYLKAIARQSKVFKGLYIMALLLIMLPIANIRTLANQEIGWVFDSSSQHNDYQVLNNLIREDNDFARTLWIPRDDQQGYYSDLKPKLRLTDIYTDFFEEEFAFGKELRGTPLNKQFLYTLKHPLTESVASQASVRYVVVPNSAEAEKDLLHSYNISRQTYITTLDSFDWLEKLDLQTNELVVYENKNYNTNTYITTANQISNTASFDPISVAALADLGQFNNDSLFLEEGDNLAGYASSRVDEAAIGDNGYYQEFNAVDTSSPITLNADSNLSRYYGVHTEAGNLQIFESPLALTQDGELVSISEKPAQLMTEFLPQEDKSLILVNGDSVGSIAVYQNTDLGLFAGTVELYGADQQPLEQRTDIAKCKSDNGVLQLGASQGWVDRSEFPWHVQIDDSARCIGPIRLDQGRYDFEMLARTRNTNFVSLLEVDDSNNITKTIDSSETRLSYRNRQNMLDLESATNIYIMMHPATTAGKIADTSINKLFIHRLEDTPLATKASKGLADQVFSGTPHLKLQYQYSAMLTNLAGAMPAYANESCSNDAEITYGQHTTDQSMVATLSLGTNLESSCKTIANIITESLAPLHISFDYQASDDFSKYGIDLLAENEKNEFITIDNIEDAAPSDNGFSHSFIAPKLVNPVQFNLRLHNSDQDNKVANITFDNIQVHSIPDLKDFFIFSNVNTDQTQLASPTTYEIVNSTTKNVSLSTQDQDFYLLMADSFNSNWQLRNPITKTVLDKGLTHLRLNDWQNAWQINISEFCQQNSDVCNKETDGSVTISLQIYFSAQRYAEIGNAVSVFSFVGVWLALIVTRLKRNDL